MPLRQGATILHLSGVGVALNGNIILRDVNIEVRLGDNWAIVGPNGSGKTTLLKVINGYQRVSSGEVRVFEEKVGETDTQEMRKKIGMVSSFLNELVVSDDNVLDVVVSGAYAQTRLWSIPEENFVRQARGLLRRLGCLEYQDRRLRELSQGERQKVLIARALMSKPGLLALDEPCAGLDLGARETFISGLDRIANPRLSILYVTHRIDEIPSCFDKALLLKDGEIISSGKIDSVLTGKKLSECFDVQVSVEKSKGRFYAIVKAL